MCLMSGVLGGGVLWWTKWGLGVFGVALGGDFGYPLDTDVRCCGRGGGWTIFFDKEYR